MPASLQQSGVVVLDLSYNELCGEIPTGGAMGWFKCLCSAPLPPCASGH
jgi:beta-glucosidase